MMDSDRSGQPPGELQRSFRLPDFASSGIITRERSFVRPQSHQNFNQMRDPGKRKSMVVTTNNKGKPTMEIYRPPTMSTGVRVDGGSGPRLNVHAKEFTMGRALFHSKSSGNVLQLGGMSAAGMMAHLPLGPPGPAPPMPPCQSVMMPLRPQLQPPPKVHFKLPEKKKESSPAANGNPIKSMQFAAGLKRSKSLTSADSLAGMAAFGLTADSMELGPFPADVKENLDKAIKDPNQLCARTLMELVQHVMRRAIESQRYALPAARHCVMIIEKEKNQTFLESLLNTCQQWYQDRDKLLNIMIGGSRPRLMAFIYVMLELYCQLRRRTPQVPNMALTPASKALLTLICKCCEECIRAPILSASDTENLFFVLTYIGRDLETQLPGDLENLLAAVRDAFLNTSAGPAITKTLLQLIELHASHWLLPGGAVLYYYPSSK